METGYWYICAMHGLGPVSQDIEQYLLDFAGLAGNGRKVVVVFPGDLNLFKIILFFLMIRILNHLVWKVRNEN
ncbi:hypothetical protein [Desulfospira joergensenii]|uniref:hypothetical protein n=1 Tax=Desulfospira joergensenii TaxID=53329 RepID=UPI0003B405A0|nr:hypothetical protein [Desulfospira joergensenii]